MSRHVRATNSERKRGKIRLSENCYVRICPFFFSETGKFIFFCMKSSFIKVITTIMMFFFNENLTELEEKE